MKDNITNKDKLQCVMQIAAIVMGIYSMVQVIVAYNQLADAVTDYQDVTNNWYMKPITDIEVSTTGTCTSGFEKWSSLSFPGIAKGACGCPANARYDNQDYDSSIASCSSNQTSANCYQDPAVTSFDMNYYKGLTICIQRDANGVGSVEKWKTYKPRPHPVNGACESSSYKYCGTSGGNYDENKGICVPNDAACPLTNIDVSSSSTLGTGYSALSQSFVNQNFYDSAYDKTTYSNYKLHYGKEIDGYGPIVDIKFGFVKRSDTKGVCYGQNADQVEKFGSTYRWSSSTTSLGLSAPSTPSTCDTYDSRYEVVDSYKLEQYMYENMAEQAICDDNYDMTSVQPNYWETPETQCTTYSSAASSKCVASSNMGCSSNDMICKDIQYQSKCGKLLAASEESTDADIGFYVRREIEWSSDCETDKGYIKNLEEPVKGALGAQLALMIINIIITLIIAFFFPIVTIWNITIGDAPCIPGDGEAEKKIIKAQKTYVGHIFRLIKAIPLVICVVIIADIKNQVKALEDLDCSDDMTNSTFNEIADTLPKVMSANIQALVMDCLQVVLFIGLQLKEKFVDSEKVEVAPEEEEGEKAIALA